jgi:hypothetical protein
MARVRLVSTRKGYAPFSRLTTPNRSLFIELMRTVVGEEWYPLFTALPFWSRIQPNSHLL